MIPKSLPNCSYNLIMRFILSGNTFSMFKINNLISASTFDASTFIISAIISLTLERSLFFKEKNGSIVKNLKKSFYLINPRKH